MDFSLQKNFFWLLVGRFNYLLFFSVFWSAALELWVSILERVRPRSSVHSERTFYSHLYMFHGRWTFGSLSLVIRTNENRKDIKTEVSWKDVLGFLMGTLPFYLGREQPTIFRAEFIPPRASSVQLGEHTAICWRKDTNRLWSDASQQQKLSADNYCRSGSPVGGFSWFLNSWLDCLGWWWSLLCRQRTGDVLHQDERNRWWNILTVTCNWNIYTDDCFSLTFTAFLQVQLSFI